IRHGGATTGNRLARWLRPPESGPCGGPPPAFMCS
ncbi:hypothetical protein A2U01_0097964, partial [Trifolium medium]|nr:hypothetical protein [Trifolium medium]